MGDRKIDGVEESENLSRRSSAPIQAINWGDRLPPTPPPPEQTANRMLFAVAGFAVLLATAAIGTLTLRELDRNNSGDRDLAEAIAREAGRTDAVIEMLARLQAQVENIDREVERLRQ